MSNFRQEFVDPIENAVNALTPGLTPMGGIGPPVRPTPPPGHAAVGIGPPVRPNPPPPPALLAQYQSLIQFVDFYCGLTGNNKPRRSWPDPGPLLRTGASASSRATGLLLASAFLRRNAALEWISADPVTSLLNDAADRLSSHAQSLLT